ncbi:MAG: CDP-diacylglycerol--glycerol-3-phosphate 3-phosphatidyltransferase [Candidatus Anaerobiospirillum pullicola]|uniref:CDP-diacylglycerol--glycerol-3-phosphate 3-phosphatidyltransferase n=1 Tax=Candidatus Anaerobiospirillum pullicola TaxID=2838451 RepID=A0A948TEV4_9GAMM|nr:CDP-diacylglycerol--glycerol-3-phosphate 3-phosphatidyltransferase [Candidatus Anaerobiospirillum pullicola]
MYNLPNILTLLRVILIPVFVGLFYYPSSSSNMFAAIVFVVAALTDLLDGYLARRLKQTTKFGAFLDPVADKIMVCTALVLIVEYYSVHVGEFFPHINLLVTIPAMVIIAREIVVSALREWMAEIGQRAQVAVNWVGKWKTTIQMTAIALLVWRYNEVMIYASLGLLAVATILTIWSMVMYLRIGLSHMTEEEITAVDKRTAVQAIAPVAATTTAAANTENSAEATATPTETPATPAPVPESTVAAAATSGSVETSALAESSENTPAESAAAAPTTAVAEGESEAASSTAASASPETAAEAEATNK